MNEVLTQNNLKFSLNLKKKNNNLQFNLVALSSLQSWLIQVSSFIFSAESLEPWFWGKTYVGLPSSYSAHTLVSSSVKWANNSFCSDLSFKNLG